MTFTCITSRGAEEWTVEVHSLLNAGWAGRRTEQVAAHARELQGLGVAPPSRVPITIPLARSLLTQDPEVEVYSPGSSGEVEYVLVVTGGRIGLTVGSDHTDREAERVSVEWSKRLYPNVVAPIVWDLADVAAHVDDLRLRAWVREGGQWTPYQDAPLRDLLPPAYWLDRLALPPRPAEAVVLFSGTVPTVAGSVRGGEGFRMSLEDPVLRRTIVHEYTLVPVTDPLAR